MWCQTRRLSRCDIRPEGCLSYGVRLEGCFRYGSDQPVYRYQRVILCFNVTFSNLLVTFNNLLISSFMLSTFFFSLVFRSTDETTSVKFLIMILMTRDKFHEGEAKLTYRKIWTQKFVVIPLNGEWQGVNFAREHQ